MAKDSPLRLVSSNSTDEIERFDIPVQPPLAEVGAPQQPKGRAGRLGQGIVNSARNAIRGFDEVLTGDLPGSRYAVEKLDQVLRTSDEEHSLVIQGRQWERPFFNEITRHTDKAGNVHALHALIITGGEDLSDHAKKPKGNRDVEVYGIVSSGSPASYNAAVRLVQLPYGVAEVLPSDHERRRPTVIDGVTSATHDGLGDSLGRATLQHRDFQAHIDVLGTEERLIIEARNKEGCTALDRVTIRSLQQADSRRIANMAIDLGNQLIQEPTVWAPDHA